MTRYYIRCNDHFVSVMDAAPGPHPPLVSDDMSIKLIAYHSPTSAGPIDAISQALSLAKQLNNGASTSVLYGDNPRETANVRANIYATVLLICAGLCLFFGAQSSVASMVGLGCGVVGVFFLVSPLDLDTCPHDQPLFGSEVHIALFFAGAFALAITMLLLYGLTDGFASLG